MALLGTYPFYLIAPWIDPPVYVVHYMKSIRNILVKIWLRMVVCHVVQEVDVGEGPAGKLVGIRPSLESDVMDGVFICCSANHDDIKIS